MITKFKIFEKDWDANLYGLSWLDMNELRKYEYDIQDYFFQKYPSKVHILNRSGHINEITLDILLRFAQKRKDVELIKLIVIFKSQIDLLKKEKEYDTKKKSIIYDNTI